PAGFVLESVLGLEFPAAVVGVIASPLIADGTIYYVDALGTVFARNAATGTITDPDKHWTTTLVDPDFAAGNPAVLPELIYTAPALTDQHIWLAGSSYGRLHAIERHGGKEIDFGPTTEAVDPFALITDLPFSSILGDSVIVQTEAEQGDRTLFITGINVILNDALVQGAETGVQLAVDISNPASPTTAWRRFMIDVNPQTNQRFSTGVSAGAGLAVDEDRQLVIGGTGQNTSRPYPDYPDTEFAPDGYVDRSDAIYAIDYVTGEFVWFNQFHMGDVFNLNDPVSTGPNRPDGPRDADVLSPPVLWSVGRGARQLDLAGVGSKGGLYRVVNRDTGDTVWERTISKPTGIGGIQAGSAYADGVVYVVGFEGIDDGFSDAQFGDSFDSGNFGNAFFATFSPAFWADVEDTKPDNDPGTGMRVKVYALDARTGESLWRNDNGDDFISLNAGAALRHLSVANSLVFVTTTAGTLFVLDARTGEIIYSDQTDDLNETMSLGLGKPHHAGMNSGTVISDGMVFVGYGLQNNPSGGILAYEIDTYPAALDVARTLRTGLEALGVPRYINRALRAELRELRKSLRKRNVPKARTNVREFRALLRYAIDAEFVRRRDVRHLLQDAGVIRRLLR
ncbi:MAG: PQQ-binding-like beta-propeller repeat protein, partial [Pseudomonadales bacterium]